MSNVSLKLIFVIIIFATIMAGSVALAKIYSVQTDNLPASETVTQEPVKLSTALATEPSDVSEAREHINEQLKHGEEIIASIEITDSYLENSLKGLKYSIERLNFPLPYELVEPENESERLETVIYRSSDHTGELSRFQKQELIDIKKERQESYYISLHEHQRRAEQPRQADQVESEAFLTALAEELPFYVPPIVVGNACQGSDTLGCFYHTDEIEVTPLALTVNGGNDECLLLSVIAHETRHYQQFEQSGVGDFFIPDLEDDANEFMRNSTVERCRV